MSHDDDCTVFVGNLSEKITEELLFELFLQAGPLRTVRIPKDPNTKKNRRFGFVNFQHAVSVDYAIKLMNGIRLFDSPLKLNVSKNRSNNNKDDSSINESRSMNETPGGHRGPNRGGRTPRSIDSRGQFSPMYDHHSPSMIHDLTTEEDMILKEFDQQSRYPRNGHFNESFHHPRGGMRGQGGSPALMRTPGRRDMRQVVHSEQRGGWYGHHHSTPRDQDQRRFRDRDSFDQYSPRNSPRHQPYERRRY